MTRALTAGAIVLALLLVSYWLLSQHGALDIITDRTALASWVNDLGPVGPLAVVGSMTIAIIFSPIPSAPIALAAGAAYGHTWGTV